MRTICQLILAAWMLICTVFACIWGSDTWWVIAIVLLLVIIVLELFPAMWRS